MIVADSPPVFILGVERSGSTWLANIFDAHPETELLMEPFTPRIEAFPEMPDRLEYLEEVDSELVEHVRGRFPDLLAWKYAYGDRPDGSRWQRRLSYDLLYPVGDITTRAAQAAGIDRPLYHLRFKNLNKNRIENPVLNRLDKDVPPRRLLVKELRLNFKVSLIEALWPEARIVVILRNPVSQVGSMLRLLKGGALHELRDTLEQIPDSLLDQERFAQYRTALTQIDSGEVIDRALAYWFVAYGVLVEDLRASGLAHRIIRHEDLSVEAHVTSNALLDFLGLPTHEQVHRYVDRSTRGGDGERSVMDTRRESESYVLEGLRRVPEDVTARCRTVAERFWPISPDPLSGYRTWLGDHLGG